MTEHLIEMRLRIAAVAAGVGAVPPHERSLPRLSAETLQVLGWTREEEVLDNMAVRAMLAALKHPDDYVGMITVLMTGNIRNIEVTANEIEGIGERWKMGGRNAPSPEFLETVLDYLEDMSPFAVAALSPRTEGGIY